jgi:hypothetical protein
MLLTKETHKPETADWWGYYKHWNETNLRIYKEEQESKNVCRKV